ncbi:hypothetical protein DSM110093_02732 [Sulfitobacter sp. DSM 110093]|uniref:Mu transposase C-terminal domain-containing protein n=1 Tax=Sulfitobacter sp. DSM 110093 TaxID=2883127 RepID=UPI001FAB9CA3|nr:Mu transposase C-terminal domain-containing protein [Sulfitobacter sp. DSM 110093]UOA32925.1 hypothetical protein DSM110093_02732 [Sulfitobacter sp. DSM 110093]
MTYFSQISPNDRVTYDGCPVSNFAVDVDKHSKEIKHYRMSVKTREGDVEIRTFRPEEICHLIDTEILVVEHGYYSPARTRDRDLYGSRELNGANAHQRERVDLIMQQCRQMERCRAMGMQLTRDGVEEFRSLLIQSYETYQARKFYGTQKPNAAQRLKRLPANSTLLDSFLKYRRANGNPNIFLPTESDPIELDLQASLDFCFVMERLGKYATSYPSSKKKVIDDMIKDAELENSYRVSIGKPEISILSTRQYERWIDLYLDPFEVTMQREGLAAAIKKFGSFEPGRKATAIGQIVQFDAWRAHMKVLDCTREEYNMMGEDDRKDVKFISPWITTAEDLATRAIVGVSFSRTPNQEASLECLRMIYRDKTYLFREIGLKKSHWNFVCMMQEGSNDSGSEFGDEPFGGAQFSNAVRLLASSQMNGAAGVSNLRGAMERFYWTCDLKWARYLPGYTAQNPQARNDRKYLTETCICFDEFQTLYLLFIAEYHKSPHRGINRRTPSAMWEELSNGVDYDPTQMPSPAQFREACGYHTTAKVTAEGIRYGGAVYTNEFIRNQRKARLVDRIAAPGESVEIMVDPYDLGGISVLANGDLISVRCLDPNMAGKSLREFQAERKLERLKAEAEACEQEGARREAHDLWRNLANAIMRSSDIGIFGYTQAEIERAKTELEFGKGQHEKPFVGRDEYVDPLTEGGYKTGQPAESTIDEGEDPDSIDNERKTSMDRFRSGARSRKHNKKRN